MIDWLWKKLFGRETAIVLIDPRPEEQLAIQRELGISTEDHEQAWLRLHQLLKSHEDRITALEGGK